MTSSPYRARVRIPARRRTRISSPTTRTSSPAMAANPSAPASARTCRTPAGQASRTQTNRAWAIRFPETRGYRRRVENCNAFSTFTDTTHSRQQGGLDPRVCYRLSAIRVAATNFARQGAGRRQWWFPCQVPQRRMATFAAQPKGPGLFLREAAFLVAYLERPHFAPRALPTANTGTGADAMQRQQPLGSPPRMLRKSIADLVPACLLRDEGVVLPLGLYRCLQGAQAQPLDPRQVVLGAVQRAATLGAKHPRLVGAGPEFL